MPVTKTTSGLLVLEDCNELDGWVAAAVSWYYPPPPVYFPPTISIGTPGYDGIGSYFCIDYFRTYGAGEYVDGGAVKNLGLVAGARVHAWHKTVSGSNGSLAVYVVNTYPNPSQTFPIPAVADVHSDWQMHKRTLPSWCSGTLPVFLSYATVGSGTSLVIGCDRLVISTSQYVTVTGLTPGQKVEIYRASDNTKITEATCAGGASSVTLDVDAEDYPEQMYLKVYGTDGSTLIETTSSYEMCGGDTWAWTSGAGTLSITVDAPIIYRSAASGTPKICNITANLKTLAGANYPGATIYFTTTLGSVSPSSDVTDANGNAETALTSTTHGIAVIQANWLGDATVPACSAYCTVHVFYEAEAPDTDKKFQVYVEGVEYAYVDGRYTQNELGAVNEFEVEIPEWLSTITPHGYVNIYRLGVKEFAGILKRIKRSLSDPSRIVLSGPDVYVLLNDRVVDTKIYLTKTPQFIIDDLLDSFPCGITPGSLSSCATSLTITIETELLSKAIPRICDLVNWKHRVTLALTLDFAESFSGGTTSATFTEGIDIFLADRDINYSPIANYIRMRGDGIVSTKQDGAKIQEQGLHQAPAFNKSISNQATLDAACQALLDMKKVEEETIPFEANDGYTPGTFGPEDYVTIISATVGMSGTYQIRKIERDLADPCFVKFDLMNRTKAYWELEEAYRRMTKDVNV